MKGTISFGYRNPETGEIEQQTIIGTFENMTFTSDEPTYRLYAIFDGKANYDFDEAEILEYIGFEKSVENVVNATNRWKGHDAVLVDVNNKKDYKIVHNYADDLY